ncbi:TIGR03032 family protein [Aphanothece sacrum]|uniref:N-acetyltransferase domain-containing protein n=1 Tax=Aphanothece sacrum FPU1 TaxID=1920663 RepID=A0A401ILB1_APHSA|nr:TIGR03032 family protein [Aphanothece sacrum]GBF82035.1 hypothetical protein AsFPU1_3459 [Aphanothece sacrum FPU1]GBF85852.1 hypothetical protein AsFPU3_2920 [Aphanothece sacrum FPU3]
MSLSANQLRVTSSPDLTRWLEQQNISIAATTYQTNRLFFVSGQANGRLKLHERLFDKPMGLYVAANRLYMTTRYQIWDFHNLLDSGEKSQEADRLYVPRTAYTTGDVNAHEIVLDNAQNVIFVNTDFSCLATINPDYSFVPLWRPSFISKLVPEDRCHLNGLAMVEGKPAYVTACSATDTAAGWRNHRLDGGVVIDVNHNEIIVTGLSMPHSPRWYQGKLWLLNSGTGEFGYIQDQRFDPIIFCPGFVRGLAFWQNFAFVGLSQLRSQSFSGLPLEKRLMSEGNRPQSGLMVIDLQTGKTLHWLYFQSIIEELFDVVVLPGVSQPETIGLQGDEIQRLVTFPESGGIVITKPTAKRPSKGATPPIAGLPQPTEAIAQLPTDQPISPVGAQGLASEVKYQRVYHLNSSNALDYDELTFPRLRQRWQKTPPQGELTGLSASINGSIVGLAIAERLNVETAKIISLFVLPDYRKQGIGTRLVAYLERELKTQGFQELVLSYSTSSSTPLALEGILQRLQWQPPQITLLLGKTTTENIAKVDWLNKFPLPPSLEVFSWPEAGLSLPASVEKDRLEPLNSLGLRQGKEVVGWVLTHRVAPDTIRYTTWEVAKPFESRGRGISLLAEAIRRQINSDVPYLTGSVSHHYPRLLQFVGRHLMPYLTGVGEVRQTSKLIKSSEEN